MSTWNKNHCFLVSHTRCAEVQRACFFWLANIVRVNRLRAHDRNSMRITFTHVIRLLELLTQKLNIRRKKSNFPVTAQWVMRYHRFHSASTLQPKNRLVTAIGDARVFSYLKCRRLLEISKKKVVNVIVSSEIIYLCKGVLYWVTFFSRFWNGDVETC